MEKITSRTSGFLVDWFTCVFHGISLDDVREILSLNGYPWEDNFCHINGYPKYLSFGNISIRYGCDDPANYGGDERKIRKDMGICLDMSGKGCRTFESFGQASGVTWLDLFLRIQEISREHKIHITRLDLSYDDFDGLLDVFDIAVDVLDRNYTGPAKSTQVIVSDSQLTNVQGCSCYVGAPSGAVRLRIYDKLAERISADKTINSHEGASEVIEDLQHWVRVELVLRGDRAGSAFGYLLQHESIGSVMLGILRNYCVFRVPSGDLNKSRWEIAPYWEAFLAQCEKIRLWTAPGLPYDVVRSSAFLERQWGQLIVVLQRLNLMGGLAGLAERVEKAHPKLSKKYQKLIDDYQAQEALYQQFLADERQKKLDDLHATYSWMLDAGCPRSEYDEYLAGMLQLKNSPGMSRSCS